MHPDLRTTAQELINNMILSFTRAEPNSDSSNPTPIESSPLWGKVSAVARISGCTGCMTDKGMPAPKLRAVHDMPLSARRVEMVAVAICLAPSAHLIRLILPSLASHLADTTYLDWPLESTPMIIIGSRAVQHKDHFAWQRDVGI